MIARRAPPRLRGAARPWPPDWARGLWGAEIDEASAYLALEAGGWLDGAAPAERRAFALLVLALVEARRAGGTRLPLGRGLGPRLAGLGAASEDQAAALALGPALLDRPELEPLCGRPGDYRPFIVDGEHLYGERDWRLETRLADALAAHLTAPPLPAGDRAAARAAAAPAGRRWTPSQAAALEAALGERLTVVTGGPGSGKTALIAGIVRGWLALGVPPAAIAVAAPTGKAANRIAESLDPGAPTPGTLHRLLGYSPGRPSPRRGDFRAHENHRLPHAAVIVDEASMVDLALLERLMRALAPDARLVLLGDAHQLPAVEAGRVLGDLSAIALDLAESHRLDPADPTGAEILEVARSVAAGELGACGTPPLHRPEALTWRGFACLEPSEPTGARRLLAAFVDHWYTTFLRAAPGEVRAAELRVAGAGVLDAEAAGGVVALLDRHQRARLLTVTRVGPAGADRINEILAARARTEAGDGRGSTDGMLASGTPIMMTRNDYDRGLMNGDAGVVVGADGRTDGRTDERTDALAVFPRGREWVALPLATLRAAVAVCYATTVHKAQGSELDHAALILPEVDLPLASRELVYTALTRARRSVTVVGSRAVLEAAVARPLDRSSGLAERLGARGAFDRGSPGTG